MSKCTCTNCKKEVECKCGDKTCKCEECRYECSCECS